MPKVYFLTALLSLAATAVAQCAMQGASINPPFQETDSNVCTTQPQGLWTFWMKVTLIEIPNPGQPAGTFEPTNMFSISDESCKTHSRYSFPSCGKPAVINESFLKQPLTVTGVQMDVGDPWFSFTYGSESFDTSSSQRCSCSKETEDALMAVGICKCTFDLSGSQPGYYVGNSPGIIPPPRMAARAPRRAQELEA